MRLFEIRRLAMSGGLVAAAFAVKYPMIGLPNVEPLTLVFFCIGYAFGPLWGIFVGCVAEGFYATFNPIGMPIAPVWIAQIISMGIVGAIGGLAGLQHSRLPISHWLDRTLLVLIGVIVTAIFDLLTNLAMAWVIGPFWAVMAAAIPFSALHIASNALLFALIFPILRRWLTPPASVPASAPADPLQPR